MATRLPLYSDAGKFKSMSTADEMELARVGVSAVPTADTSAANKLYVDNAIEDSIDGLTAKEPVKVATTGAIGNLDLSIALATPFDGVPLVTDDQRNVSWSPVLGNAGRCL